MDGGEQIAFDGQYEVREDMAVDGVGSLKHFAMGNMSQHAFL